jgi:hypothetical protein
MVIEMAPRPAPPSDGQPGWDLGVQALKPPGSGRAWGSGGLGWRVMCSFALRAFALVVVFLSAGCAGPAQGSRPVVPSSFPEYAGRAVELFDDKIDAEAVGLGTVDVQPRNDPVRHERVNQADAIARLRVSTVTVDMVAGQPLYHVSFVVVASLVNKDFSDNRIELSIGPSSPSFGIVKWLDTRIVGRTFIGFVRRFAGAEEPVIRFHLSADSPDVVAAVREATTLGDLKPLTTPPQ